jgi:hypothetical protein
MANNCTAILNPMVEGVREFVVEGELISDMPRPVVDPASQIRVFETMAEVTPAGTIKYRLRAAVGETPAVASPVVEAPQKRKAPAKARATRKRK